MSDTDPLDPALARLLENPALWAEASSDLRERTLAEALRSDTNVTDLGAARHLRGRDGRGDRGRQGRRTGWSSRPLLLAAAAVVVVGLAVAGGVQLLGDTAPKGTEVALAGTEEAPAARATAHLRREPAGVSVTLEIDDLPPAPEDTFYEAWLIGEQGKVSAGTFHQRGDQDEIKLWLGVDPADYDAISVTRQPVQGGTTAQGVVVMKGPLPH